MRSEDVIDVQIVETPGLGDRSYLVTDGEVAVAIDPQRDIDRVLEVAGDVPITHVLETHIHNDYVTGGLALAQRCGATYVVNAEDPVAFERHGVTDGDVVTTGSLAITAIHTPGHTPTHLSYAVAVDGEPVAVFTGGSVLFGAMGRTDLVDPARTEELTRAQHRSAHRLADALPDHTVVYPTHGFGSFCSATETKGSESTIGKEKVQNNALTKDEDAFVTELMAGLTAYPRYYARMAPLNLEGPDQPDLSPPEPVDRAVLQHRLEHGEWVVDLRARQAYAAGHVRGTVAIELADPFATYLGWTVPWGVPITLIGDSTDQVAEAQRQLVRIGIDQLAGAAIGEPAALAPGGEVSSYRRATFAELAAERAERGDGIVVLDVRRPDEWEEGHVEGAVHIPFYELRGRQQEVPDGEVWVHCKSGYRASIGASLMDCAGRDVVHLDEDWEQAAAAGLPIVEPAG
jgi:glyoxylase-like metal-dependent hydrolase (beta-lactamase superfamily II)/rhodanese-related sulfurtransferase